MGKVAIVTGGTSGIGLETLLALEKAGVTAYALSRHPAEGVKNHVVCDVSDEASVRLAVGEVIRREKRVDILVNCAGFGISGAVEYTDPAEARRQIDVNLFGTDRVNRAVLPVMRAQGGGRIVCVSSVAAVAPIPVQAWYSVSKAGINALVMAMSNEVKSFGVSVCAVMPGDIKTGFTAARQKSSAGDEAYGGRIARSGVYPDIDFVAVVEAQRPPQMVWADDLEGVHVMGPLRYHDGALHVADLGPVGDDVPEAAALAREPVDDDARRFADEVQLADVLHVNLDVQGALEGCEPELVLELDHVAVLADVIAALAHPGCDRPVDGHVVRGLEDDAVFVVLFLELIDAPGGQLDALPSSSEIADDELLVQQLEDAFGGGLLTHLKGIAQLAAGYGDVIIHRTHERQLPQRE